MGINSNNVWLLDTLVNTLSSPERVGVFSRDYGTSEKLEQLRKDTQQLLADRSFKCYSISKDRVLQTIWVYIN